MATVSLRQAEAIVDGTLSAARAAEAKPVAVVVLDNAGHVVAAKREDGATMFRYDIALGKAWGAAAFGVSSRALAQKAQENPNFMLSLTNAATGRILPNPGGLPIFDVEGKLLGAVGVSGDSGDRDEAFAAAGVENAQLSSTAS